MGGRGGRVGVCVPDREGVQSRARRAPAQACRRAALARAARSGDRRAVGSRRRPVPLHHGAARGSHRSRVRRPGRRAGVDREEEPAAELDLPIIARAPKGDEASVRFVLAELERVDDAVEGAQGRKGHALSAISEPGFWERADRFELLAEAEYLDRLLAATRTADRLGARLHRSVRADGRANSDLVGLLAGRLYVLDRALEGIESGAPTEVFVHIRPAGGVRGGEPERSEFASTVAQMYVHGPIAVECTSSCSTRRTARTFSPSPASAAARSSEQSRASTCSSTWTRSGMAVLSSTGIRFRSSCRPAFPRRVTLRRRRPRGPTAIAGAEAPSVIVRRYRPGKAPLVRDSVRGYRTGRLDRVLGGDFDLY